MLGRLIKSASLGIIDIAVVGYTWYKKGPKKGLEAAAIAGVASVATEAIVKVTEKPLKKVGRKLNRWCHEKNWI